MEEEGGSIPPISPFFPISFFAPISSSKPFSFFFPPNNPVQFAAVRSGRKRRVPHRRQGFRPGPALPGFRGFPGFHRLQAVPALRGCPADQAGPALRDLQAVRLVLFQIIANNL